MSEDEIKSQVKKTDLWEDILSMNPELTGAAGAKTGEAEKKDIEDTKDEAIESPEKSAEADTGSAKKKRDPFKNMGPVSSSDAALKSKDLASRSELKQIKKAGVRYAGKKVVTDDVKKLKSLSEDPDLPSGHAVNFYKEPVRIEYYIPKESRFNVEIRHLYIPLIDPVIEDKAKYSILNEHMNQKLFFDLVAVMNNNPGHITDIIEAYGNTMDLYETISRTYMEVDENPEVNYKKIFYLCEALIEYEPTIAALDFLGPFMSWNLNWLTRKMNSLGIEFAASDKTVSYFIKLRNLRWEENHLEYDERFEILAALFYEQAYPNRGLSYHEDDYFLDIFDKKH